MIEIREINLEEAYTIHKQIPEFHEADSIEYFTSRLENKAYYAICRYENSYGQGYLIAYDKYHDGSIYCWMAGVIPQFRTSGVLSDMMRELEKYAKENNYSSINIKTRNTRREMLAFLVKNGFLFTEVTTSHPLQENRISLVKYI